MTCPGSACSSALHPDDILKLLEGDDLYQLINMVGTLLGSPCKCKSLQAKLSTQQCKTVSPVQQVCNGCFLPTHEGLSCAQAKVSSGQLCYQMQLHLLENLAKQMMPRQIWTQRIRP